MADDDLCMQPLGRVARMIADGDISAVELTTILLRRILRVDPAIRSFVTVLGEQAELEARARDASRARGEPLGPLHGIPISVKDNIDVAGARTTIGSPIFAERRSEVDAAAVQRLRAAGAIVIAKANMWELAIARRMDDPKFGPTLNPWNPGRETGGSSSGSGAAVAAGLSYASIGSDGGGSIRVPAAFCGVAGFKPTFDTVPREGLVSHLHLLDHLGPITRTAADAAIVMGAIGGLGPRAAGDPSPPVGLRIGAVELDSSEPIAESVRDAVVDVGRVLEREGARLIPIRLPEGVRSAPDLVRTLAMVDGAEFYADLLEDRAVDLGPAVRAFLEAGRTSSVAMVERAGRLRLRIREHLLAAMADVDVVVLPTSPTVAPPAPDGAARRLESDGDRDETIRYTAMFNLGGQPAMAIPCGFDPDGLPISVQLAARPHADAMVLGVARAYQQVTDWHLQRPPGLP